MSGLLPGDSWMHYSDGSHRWPGPDERGHAQRRQAIEEHMADHRRRLGDMPARPSVRNATQTHYRQSWLDR